MVTVTTEQARARFISLPPTLQDAVFSEQTAEIIATTLEKYHVSEERGENVPILVGWVLLGFLHIEDLQEEIAAAAGIPKPLAKDITESLSNKIFEPLRGVLAQSHAPVPKETEAAVAPVRINIEGMTESPKIIGDTTFTAVPGSQKNVIIGPKVMQGIRPPGARDMEQGTGNITTPSSPLPKVPEWSVKPNLGGAMASPTTMVKKTETGGEFARLAAQKGAGPQPAANSPTSAPSPENKILSPKPTILQSTVLPTPIQNAPNLNNPQKAVDILSGKKSPVPLPIKPAMIEIGGFPKNQSQNPALNAPRAINYSDIKSPSTTPSPIPSSPAGQGAPGRQITEITSPPQFPAPPSSKPMMPPAPTPFARPTPPPFTQPMRPQQLPTTPTKPAGLAPITVAPIPTTLPVKPHPPTMPASPQPNEKVIVKDFKEGE